MIKPINTMSTRPIANLIFRAILALIAVIVIVALAYAASRSSGAMQMLAGPLWGLRTQSWGEGVLLACALLPAILSPIIKPNFVTAVLALLGMLVWLWFGYVI